MQRLSLTAGALLMACNAILGIDDGYHKVDGTGGGAGRANGGSGATSGKNGAGATSGSSGSSGTNGGTGGTGNAGNAGMSSIGQAGDGEAGNGDATGRGGSGAAGSGGSGATETGGSGGNGATGGTGGSSAGKGGTGGDIGQGGQDNPPVVESALVTSAVGAYWQTATWTESTNAATLTVNDTVVAQDWEGFGMAFTEAGADNLMALTPAKQQQVLNLLFGTDGAHFAWGRIPVGANGYALSRYTEDETAGDTALAGFSIARDKQVLLPFIKAAHTANPALRFWASAWTPPTWMKDNADFDGGHLKGDAATMTAYASYFVKFVEAYAAEGIHIELVAPQAEPSYAQAYPSCQWTPDMMLAFIGNYLGPALNGSNVDVSVMLGNFSDDASGTDPSIVQSVMGSPSARSYVKVLGYEWTMLSQVANDDSYGLPIWQTEHKAGNYPWNPQGYPSYATVAPNDLAYAVESWGLIRQWIAAGVTEYNAWHAVLDKVGLGLDTERVWAQNSLITIDRNADSYAVTPTFYVFRHFSQFVEPGAKVVGTSGGSNALAFKNPDGSLVAVMYNPGGATTYTVAIGGKKLDFAMPAAGWATLKLANSASSR